MLDFASGLVTMGHLVASLFFLRFWTRTRDVLFAVFAVAFALFALEQVLLAWDGAREEQTWFYLIRLAAFVLIIAGIVQKNRTGRRPD